MQAQSPSRIPIDFAPWGAFNVLYSSVFRQPVRICVFCRDESASDACAGRIPYSHISGMRLLWLKRSPWPSTLYDCQFSSRLFHERRIQCSVPPRVQAPVANLRVLFGRINLGWVRRAQPILQKISYTCLASLYRRGLAASAATPGRSKTFS